MRNPEAALLAKEDRDGKIARAEMLRSPERRNLNEAMRQFAAKWGDGDAAAWACVMATRHTLLANPRSTREQRIEAAMALFAEASE